MGLQDMARHPLAEIQPCRPVPGSGRLSLGALNAGDSTLSFSPAGLLQRRRGDGASKSLPGSVLALASIACANAALVPSARAQSAPPSPVENRAQSVECLTLAIAYEAGFEPVEGQEAVAEVVLNRLRHPAFPKSVCGVVFAGSTLRTGCQFTFTCDGSLRRRLPDSVLSAARAVAEQAIDGRFPARVAGATNYHADYVNPYWAPSLVRVAKIGAHIFYRAPGTAAPPGAAGPAQVADRGGTATPAAPRGFAPWGLAPMAPHGAR